MLNIPFEIQLPLKRITGLCKSHLSIWPCISTTIIQNILLNHRVLQSLIELLHFSLVIYVIIKRLECYVLFPFTIVARSTTKYMALNAINLQCTFDQGKSPNGRDPCHPRAHICEAGGTRGKMRENFPKNATFKLLAMDNDEPKKSIHFQNLHIKTV